MSTGAGDKLARGAASAQFPPAGGNVTQEQWDRMWESEEDVKKESSNVKKEAE